MNRNAPPPHLGVWSCSECGYRVPTADEDVLLSSGDGDDRCECGGTFTVWGCRMTHEAQAVRSMVVRLCRTLPPNVDARRLTEAGMTALDDWRSSGGDAVESFETVVTRVFLLVLQTDERVPAHIREAYAGATTLRMPPLPAPIPAI